MKEAAEYIQKNKHEIIDAWEKIVNAEIEASETTEAVVLRNLLPNLLDDIAGILMRQDGKPDKIDEDNCEEIITKSIAHGRHRATSSQYTVKQMLREYILLNRVLTKKLSSENLYTTEISVVITYALETSMSHAVSAFSDSLQEMRETLVGTLAHDLRNPISAAYFCIDIMKHSDGEERFKKVKDMTLKSLRRSLDLMEGLLDAISVKAGEGITLNFTKSNIVNDIKHVYEEACATYSNKINFKCEDEEIEGVFDGTAVRRIMENLLTNAVKYGAEDEPITIKIEHEKEKVIIKVHNKGKPITEKNQKIIFNFLESTDEEASGELKSWGMGLTFVKMAAEAHGGHVELISDTKHGTTFCVILAKHSNKPGKVRSKLNYQD